MSAGHNGCLHCLAHVQSRNAQCPLCRTVFDPEQELVCNHEMRDLIHLATSMFVDDKSKNEGWEAFPTTKLTSELYAHEVQQGRQAHLDDNYPCSPPDHNPFAPSAPHISDPHLQPDDPEQQAALRNILTLEPPQWLPDSHAASCANCHLPFKALTRLRHHCRLCGKIFCHACCHKRLLLPPRYMQRDPQRTCELCSALLVPLQPYLAGTLSRSVQPPIHDAVADKISLRSWLNNPFTSTLEDDIYKVANILQTFTHASRAEPEKGLPTAVLQGARGLAVLTALKVGAGWSAAYGTGLVVTRKGSNWSAPCAIACTSFGWGLQLGTELADLLLVLPTDDAVRAFCGGANLGIGGNASAAVGPLGRVAEAQLVVGESGSRASIYSYSMAQGAFLGVAVEGSVVKVRDAVNHNFYGFPVTARQLLLEDSVPQPPAGSTLYDALHGLMFKFENRRVAGGRQRGGGSSSAGASGGSSSSRRR